MPCNHRTPRRCGGATLIELLVVAAVIFVLLGLTIPIVRHLRVRQDDLYDVTNAASILNDFRFWSTDRDDITPNAGLHDDPLVQGFYPPSVSDSQYVGLYQSPVWNWSRLLRLSGYTPSRHWHTTLGPDDVNGQIDLSASDSPEWLYSNPSRFKMTYTTLFDAAIWSSEGASPIPEESIPSVFKRVRWGMIAFPSSKGMIVNRSRRHNPRFWHVGFVDGSARLVDSERALPGVAIPWSESGRQGSPILATNDGYLGRDF